MTRDSTPVLTKRFEEALALAFDLHRNDLRKGSAVPYFSHLMSVAALVLEDGGDEDEAIAALLHDALEDHADRIDAAEIERRFGARVRAIVESCTDTPPDHAGGLKPEWRPRKEAYIAHIRAGGGDGSGGGDGHHTGAPLRVSLADKVHNARSIVRDHRELGDDVWERFTASREDTLWYYRSLARAYREAGARGHLMDELERMVEEVSPDEFGHATPILSVSDFERSVQYYVNTLGFRLAWSDGNFGCVVRGHASFMLCEGSQGHPGTWTWTAVPDADALHEELIGRGAKIRHPPTNYPWGSRELHVFDPDGHVLRFGSDHRPGEALGPWLDENGVRWYPQPDGEWTREAMS